MDVTIVDKSFVTQVVIAAGNSPGPDNVRVYAGSMIRQEINR